MTIKVATRGQVPAFLVLDVLREALAREKAGHNVIHMEAGQPATGVPPAMAARVMARLGAHPLGYTEAMGIPPLRQAIAARYQREYGLAVDPARVLVVTGSSAAFQLAFLTVFEAGDKVALAVPCYPAYRHILSALGLEPVLVPVGAEDGFQMTAAVLARTLAGHPDLQGVIVANPSNPVGAMLSPDQLSAVMALAREASVRVVSDEIYHGITFAYPAATALAYDEEAIVINSLSKYFCMTGWRLGWLVVPESLARPMECLHQSLAIAPPTLAQHLALETMADETPLQALVQRYAQNRDILRTGLPEIGLGRFAPPDGAFYVYVETSSLGGNSMDVCRRLLLEQNVAATPGHDFDPFEGRRFMRLSYAGTPEEMHEALRRLAIFAARG